MNHIQAAIYAYFHNGEMPPDNQKEWQPDPPKQWWGPPENKQERRISDEVKQQLDPWLK